MSKQLLAVVALLGSSVVSAATVTVTQSAPNLLTIGGSYFLTLSMSADMPITTGATFGVTFDPNVVSLNNTLPPAVGTNFNAAKPIAPFNFAVYTAGANPGTTGLISVTTTTATAGPFNFLNLEFTAIGAGPANFQFYDGGDLGWVAPDESLYDGLVSYGPSNVIVGIPVPAAAWLFVSAIGGLATLKRRQAR